MIALGLALRRATVAASPLVTSAQAPAEACALLSAQEVDAALGRSGSKAGQASGGRGQPAQCRFANSAAGDLTVMLTPSSPSAKEDHALRPEILKEEKMPVEKIAGLGDSAYYWTDSVEVLTGDRILTIWMHRTPQSVSPDRVRAALIGMARQALGRLGSR
jgi:hypothetical protein